MPLPPGSSVGKLPDGSLVWIGPDGTALNPDGSPIEGAARPTPLQPATPTSGGQVGTTTLASPTPLAEQPTQATGTPAAAAVPQAQNINPDAMLPASANLPTGTLGPGQQGPNTQMQLPDGTNPMAAQMMQTVNAQVQQAHIDVADQAKTIQDLQGRLTKSQDASDPGYDPNVAAQLTQQIDAAQIALSSAETRLASASKNQSDTAQQVLTSVQLSPAQRDYYEAQSQKALADAKTAGIQSDLLLDPQTRQNAKDLVVAQTGAYNAQAAASQADADSKRATTPQQQQLLASQAANYQAQADTSNQLLPALKAKAEAEVGQVGAQTDYYKSLAASTDADATLKTAQANLLVPAQAAQATGGAAQAQAQAQATLAGIQQNQQGPLYGLQQQTDLVKQAINTIAGQVFGPGGSGDPKDANDLLNQFITAKVGGTTVGQAAVAAAGAQQNIFQTQAAMANQASQAATARAGQLAGLAGNALGTLQSMNAYAPKGSTEGAAAFGQLMDYMGQRMQQGPMAPPNMQQMAPTPQLPSFLQAFAAGHQAGQAQANAQNQGNQGSQGTPTINVNVNGQGSGPSGSQPMPMPANATPPPMIPMNSGMNLGAMPGAGPAGQQSTPLSGFTPNVPSAMPNYLNSLVDPASMLNSARNLYGGGITNTPGLGAMAGIG